MKKQFVFTAMAAFCIVSWIACTKRDIQNHLQLFHKESFKDPGFVSDEMVLRWNENVSKVISRTIAPPPTHCRHFAMAQIAVHDALNSIKPKYETYALKDCRMANANANADAAVASAAYWTLKDIDAYLQSIPTFGLSLQTEGNDWDGWYASSLAGIPDGEAKEAGIALGKKAAEAMMEKRSMDNFKEAGVVNQFLPVTEINPPMGTYRATTNTPPYPTNIKGLPLWGTLMKPFCIAKNDQFRPVAPPSLLSAVYTADYNEVKTLGVSTGSGRTAEQALIANFWQETAVNIWNRFCRNVVVTKKMSAWRTAHLLAMTNAAMFDGFLSAFDGMYHYYRWRPETAIRLAAQDDNPQTEPDENWLPFVIDIKIGPVPQTPTPPLPEYPNPQAVVGASVVEVLQGFFETDKTEVDLTSGDVLSSGISRHYSSFSQAAQENLNSRIYAGFNFRYSMNVGNNMGKKVGEYVFTNCFKGEE